MYDARPLAEYVPTTDTVAMNEHPTESDSDSDSEDMDGIAADVVDMGREPDEVEDLIMEMFG